MELKAVVALELRKEPMNPKSERVSAARQEVDFEGRCEANPRGERAFDVLRDLPYELPPGDGASRAERLLQVQRNEHRCPNDRRPIRGDVRCHKRLAFRNHERRRASVRI